MASVSPKTEKRMLENEAVFRERNNQLQGWFFKFKQLARKESNSPTSLDAYKNLRFYCECSDENCHKRIKLSQSAYKRIHKNPKSFTIVPGHEVTAIEDVVTESPRYSVVKKHKTPPLSPGGLNATSVDNA